MVYRNFVCFSVDLKKQKKYKSCNSGPWALQMVSRNPYYLAVVVGSSAEKALFNFGSFSLLLKIGSFC